MDLAIDLVGNRIGLARMIDVAGGVAPNGAVERPARVQVEQISVLAIVRVFPQNALAAIFDDELAPADGRLGEKSQPGARPGDPEGDGPLARTEDTVVFFAIVLGQN